MSAWDDRLSFLKAVRDGWVNIDYVEFLVQRVWRIDRAVDVADFGCGFGYIGILLMPLLPKGSTYTGIDSSETLLNEAKKILCGSPYDTRFIHADLREYSPKQDYDIAITNAVLRHIPGLEAIIKEMVQSVRPGGWVICMETDRLLQDAGRYLSNLAYDGLRQTELYQKIWRCEWEHGGRDYRTGVKIPQMMQALGLKDIQVRINDRVKFANPHDDDYEHVYQSMVEANGWNRQYNREEIREYVAAMMDRGLTAEEAERFVDNERLVQNSVQAGYGTEYILEMACTPITFGKK